VGAGPAGCALACFLRRRGHDVLVLDAARFPRDKTCGESVSPEGWRLIAEMGAEERVRALRPHALHGMRLTSPDGTSFRGRYRNRAGFALRRLVLDQALVETARSAGAEVRQATPVRGLLRERGVTGGVVIGEGDERRPIRARVVVGADGRASLVSRSLGLRRCHPRLRRFAVRAHFEGMQGLGEQGEMHVGGGGYCGVAPLSPTLANVAFVLGPRELRDAAGDLTGYLTRTLRERWPSVAERLEGARLLAPPSATGPLAVEALATAAPGALLVGDAAGFYDPFTGEGVTLALRTAEIAASVVDAALGARAAPALLEPYERQRAQATREKFRFNRALQLAVGCPPLFNHLARRLARRPDLADHLVGIAGDFVPARSAFALGFLRELALG
jgi:geranylgeranyl reductase family protein